MVDLSGAYGFCYLSLCGLQLVVLFWGKEEVCGIDSLDMSFRSHFSLTDTPPVDRKDHMVLLRTEHELNLTKHTIRRKNDRDIRHSLASVHNGKKQAE